MDVQQIKSYIETNCLDTHTMIIDESMEPWVAVESGLAHPPARTVVKDDVYLQQTWDVTPQWREHLQAAVRALWQTLPIDTKSVDTFEQVCKLAKEHGVLVSSGKPGYNLLIFVCIAVRSPEQTVVLLKAYEPLQ
ncbi:hypothetical protein PR003_g22017 [Phytophthora rubi]|uniref:Uncharacterized protein n=1 Tax=Phytophthora rubi TaxID=129364 RepID=A0A6A4D7N8_9STRA|nr:hypothetical protein PR001_g20500 [Phytophthora rubi]KAE9303401.1 hypothetical protein PR003_g22017 [Phytophthora rubi]